MDNIRVDARHTLCMLLDRIKSKNKFICSIKYQYDYTSIPGHVVIACKIETSNNYVTGSICRPNADMDQLRKDKIECLMIAAEDLGIYLQHKDTNEVTKKQKKKQKIKQEVQEEPSVETEQSYYEEEEEQIYEGKEEPEEIEEDEEDDGDTKVDSDISNETDSSTNSEKPEPNITPKQRSRYKALLAERDIRTIERFNEVLTKVREDYDIEIHSKDELDKDNIDIVLDAIEEITEGYTF